MYICWFGTNYNQKKSTTIIMVVQMKMMLMEGVSEGGVEVKRLILARLPPEELSGRVVSVSSSLSALSLSSSSSSSSVCSPSQPSSLSSLSSSSSLSYLIMNGWYSQYSQSFWSSVQTLTQKYQKVSKLNAIGTCGYLYWKSREVWLSLECRLGRRWAGA